MYECVSVCAVKSMFVCVYMLLVRCNYYIIMFLLLSYYNFLYLMFRFPDQLEGLL